VAWVEAVFRTRIDWSYFDVQYVWRIWLVLAMPCIDHVTRVISLLFRVRQGWRFWIL